MPVNRIPTRTIGNRGEDAAAHLLQKSGLEIIERNFSCKIGEIDIIAADLSQRMIVFAEVKTRSGLDHGLPCEAVGPEKQRKIRLCSQLWLRIHAEFSGYQPRFDIVEIIQACGSLYGRHLENAF